MNYTSKSLKKMILLTPKKTQSKNSNFSPTNEIKAKFEYFACEEKVKSEEAKKEVQGNIEIIKR